MAVHQFGGAPLATVVPLQSHAPLRACSVYTDQPVLQTTATGAQSQPFTTTNSVSVSRDPPLPPPRTQPPVAFAAHATPVPFPNSPCETHLSPLTPNQSGLDSNWTGGGTGVLAVNANDGPRSSTSSTTTGDSLTLQTFQNFFDAEGRCSNEYDLHKVVYWQGIAKEARPTVWPCLLGVYPVDLVTAQREQHGEKLKSQYQDLLKYVTACERNQFSTDAMLGSRIKEIEKDVPRTDRDVAFYSEEDGEQLAMLRRILISYVVYNKDLGYVQGMNDVASVVLLVMKENETMAFWCFVKVMEKIGGRFTDLAAEARRDLSSLVEHLDPQLHAHISWLSGGDWKFCLRWVLLCFKRELPMNDVIDLWERIWSKHTPVDLTIYLVAGLLVQNRFSLLSHRSEEDLHQFAYWISKQLHVKSLVEGGQVLLEKIKPPSRHSSGSEAISSTASVVSPPKQGFVPRSPSEQPPHLSIAQHVPDPATKWEPAAVTMEMTVPASATCNTVPALAVVNQPLTATEPVVSMTGHWHTSTSPHTHGVDFIAPTARSSVPPSTSSIQPSWSTQQHISVAQVHHAGGRQQFSSPDRTGQTAVVMPSAPGTGTGAAATSYNQFSGSATPSRPGNAEQPWSSQLLSGSSHSPWSLDALSSTYGVHMVGSGLMGLTKAAAAPLSHLHSLVSPSSGQRSLYSSEVDMA